MRTGERPKGLRNKTVIDFTPIGLDFKERQNALRRNPYTGRLSEAEKAEIKRQVRAVTRLAKPELGAGERKEAERHLSGRTALVQRKHVEEFLKDYELKEAFNI